MTTALLAKPELRRTIAATDERESLFGEVLHRIDKIEGLFQMTFLGGLTFLSVVVQPSIDPHTGFLLPLAVCAIFLKVAKHDRRIGQITFHLRYVLGSCWEIIRRHLFDGTPLTDDDQAILTMNDITITEQMRAMAARLQMKSKLDFWSNTITIAVFSGTSLCIASFRTWHVLLALDPLTICLWVLGYVAVLISILSAVRKRIR